MGYSKIKILIFDWGDTIMVDNPLLTTPMYQWDKVSIISNADIVLHMLFNKFKIVVASNAGVSDEKMMKMALERVDIAKYFDLFFTSKELGFEKPNILFFKRILEITDCKPNECIMIGNSYEKDIIGAKKAGINTIYFNSKSHKNILFRDEYEKNNIKNLDFADIIINNLLYISDALKLKTNR